MSAKKKNRKRDSFREWLSDNLRYILLILAILAALILLFFGVRAISTRLKGSTAASAKGTEAPAGGVVSGAAPTEGSAEASGGTGSGASLSTAEGADALASAAGGAVSSALAVTNETDITEVIENYYKAMSTQDLAAIQKITDVLPESQAATVSSSKNRYSDVKVYTKEGTDDNTRIVYAYYKYLRDGQAGPLPGLSQMYVRKGADGTWKIVFSELDEATGEHIKTVTEGADVQALIKEVKAEYDAAQNPSASADSETEAAEAKSGTTGNAEPPEEVSITPEAENPSDDSGEGTGGEDGNEGSSMEAGAGEQESPRTEYDPNETWEGEINSSCNVRSGPGYDYTVIGGVPAGEKVTVVGDIDNGWWHIVTDDVDGYVGGKFIS